MTGRELIKKILDAKAENAHIEVLLGKTEVLIPYNVEVSIREEGVATYAEIKVLKGQRGYIRETANKSQ